MNTQWHFEKIPILQDNFVFIVHDGQEALVVDPGEAGPVIDFLQRKKLECRKILVTHHHGDHIGGVAGIKEKYSCEVLIPEKNKSQIPEGTKTVQGGDAFSFKDLNIQVWDVPGHTLGHIAYWLPEHKALFSGDVLFALGCGRLFEGTYEQMFTTLQKIKTLPVETLIYCTHDYYPTNERFCRSEGFDIAAYKPTLPPLSLAQEKNFNPFLKAPTVDAFKEVRLKRNSF